MSECVMCQLSDVMRATMRAIEQLPETDVALYDDAVTDVYNAADNAVLTLRHECDNPGRCPRCGAPVKKHGNLCRQCLPF